MKWLSLELWGEISLGFLFLLMIIATTLIFSFQEIFPILRHAFEKENSSAISLDPRKHPALKEILNLHPEWNAEFVLWEEEEPILFSRMGKKPVVVISTGLASMLARDEVEAAVAHEMAHIGWRKRGFVWGIFISRILMFFNPVVLIEFRRLIQEEEKICDDIAVAMTRKPQALSACLRKLHFSDAGASSSGILSNVRTTLEKHSRNILIGERILRLENADRNLSSQAESWQEFGFTLTGAVVLLMNYFIV